MTWESGNGNESKRTRPHYIRANTSTTTPRFCLFVDTESWVKQTDAVGSSENSLRFGVAIYNDRMRLATVRNNGGDDGVSRRVYVFKSVQEFVDLVLRIAEEPIMQKQKLYVYAHNMRYDFIQMAVSETFVRHGFVQTKALPLPRFITMEYTLAVVRDGKRYTTKVEFQDTLNIYQTSLAFLGKSVGLFKKGHEDWNTPDDSLLIDYCTRDSEVIEKAMNLFFDFISEHKFGSVRPTLAGQAMEAYKTRFMTDDIQVPSDAGQIATERESFHGGRTDCFYRGITPWGVASIAQLDVNSLYPSVMVGNPFPIECVRVMADESGAEGFLADGRDELMSIAEVYIDTPEPCFAKTEKDINGEMRLIFPIGSFTTVLTHPELEYAVQHGYVKRWIKRYVYTSARIFDGYVTTLYNMRKEYKARMKALVKDGKYGCDEYYLCEVYQMICKLLMNSLYGKWGQRTQEFEEIGTTDDYGEDEYYNSEEDRMIRTLMFGGKIYACSSKMSEGRDACPSIASTVTGYARMLMWKFLSACPERSYYYMDTDSIFGTTEAVEALKEHISSTELGYLDVEQRIDWMETFAPKDYVKHMVRDSDTLRIAVGERYNSDDGDFVKYEKTSVSKVKGISARAVQVGENDYLQQQFSSLSESIKKGRCDVTFVNARVKHVGHEYTKGIVMSDGWIRPFIYDDNVLRRDWQLIPGIGVAENGYCETELKKECYVQSVYTV